MEASFILRTINQSINQSINQLNLFMTREEAKQWIPILQAYSEGKQIQFRQSFDSSWMDVYEPIYDATSLCHRIKPEPEEIIVIKFGDGSSLVVKDMIQASKYTSVKLYGATVKHFREIV